MTVTKHLVLQIKHLKTQPRNDTKIRIKALCLCVQQDRNLLLQRRWLKCLSGSGGKGINS